MLKFEPLIKEEQDLNVEAAKHLTQGKYYTFDPPVEATGVPVGGSEVFSKEEMKKLLKFNRGWYLGFINNKHAFQGHPVNDPRVLPARFSNYSGSAEKNLRACFFHVDFIGGSSYKIDDNQKP